MAGVPVFILVKITFIFLFLKIYFRPDGLVRASSLIWRQSLAGA